MKNKNFEKRAISLFEIIILIASIYAFSYFVGSEFRFVSAADISGIPAPTGVDSVSSNLPGATSAIGNGISSTPAPTSALSGLSSDMMAEAKAAAGVGTAGTAATSGANLPDMMLEAKAGAKSIATWTPPTGTKLVGWEKFGGNLLSSWASISINAGIAAGLYYGTTYVLQWAGVSPQLSDYISHAIGIGFGIGAGLAFLYSAATGTSVWGIAIAGITVSGLGLIGAGIGALFALITYRDIRIDKVQFNCLPWHPATGGGPNGEDDCQLCNKGPLPCTQYKCESLGQSCKMFDYGGTNEACVWNNRNDIQPPKITSWDGPLDKTKFEYNPITATLPGDTGVIIKDKTTSDGCIPAFTRLTYGISIDKPGICKADLNRTDNFDEMKTTLTNGGPYNYTLISVSGGLIELSNEAINLSNGGNFNVYVRCQSANGYSNTGTFVFKYCVQKTPDTTAPTIAVTEPSNGWFVENGKTSQDVNIYTDKPADCKWSHNDELYDNMPNTMTCAQSITEMNANTYYKCSGTLDGLKDSVENDFYFNCKSYPKNAPADRYTMATNYKYVLYGTQPLVIDSVTPDVGSTIKDATQSVKVTLTAHTSAGYNKGQAYCDFKETSQPDSAYVLFANTNSYQHSQDLWLDAGNYDYTIKCCDLAELNGNCATQSTQFSVESDFQPPTVVRVYNENNQLNVVTDEPSSCVYGTNSCSYDFSDGINMSSMDSMNHFTDWNTNSNYYVKCQDQFGNKPNPDECSITVRPFSSF